jgi:hypothetical protein
MLENTLRPDEQRELVRLFRQRYSLDHIAAMCVSEDRSHAAPEVQGVRAYLARNNHWPYHTRRPRFEFDEFGEPDMSDLEWLR